LPQSLSKIENGFLKKEIGQIMLRHGAEKDRKTVVRQLI
jgi:hypothetical protein